MLDGLLSRGFSFKCKSLIKASRERIEVARRRAEAKQRFLKEDLAKLLSNGLDINAYGRTEEYIAGMNILSCYGFIELSCEYIVKQLSRMQKQGECPEECREAVASLIFAAARFSDLPELRELRDTFQQKYGSGLDVFVNQKFVESLSSKPPLPATKIQVLQDIASEFSIKWDSWGFEQRTATSSAMAKVDIQKTDIVTPRFGVLNEKNRIPSYGEDNALRRDKFDHTAGRQERIHHSEKPQLKNSSHGDNDILFHGKHTQHRQTENKRSCLIEKEAKELEESSSSSSHGKILDNGNVGYTRHGDAIHTPRTIESTEALFRKKTEFAPSRVGHQGKTESAFDSLEYSYQDSMLSDHSKSSSNYGPPPPYVKSKDNIALPPYDKPKEGKNRTSRGSRHAAFDVDGHSGDTSSYKSSSNRILNELDHPNHEEPYHASQNNTLSSTKKDEGSADRLKPPSISALPPPYIKSKDKMALPPYIKPEENTYKGPKYVGSDMDAHFVNPSSFNTNAANSSSRALHEPNHTDRDELVDGSAKARIYGTGKELAHHAEKISLPKPRSIRRKHHKSSSGYDVEDSVEDVGAVKKSSSSRRKDPSRKGLQLMFDEEHQKKDDEERMIDKLLIHYSKKPTSYDAEKSRKKFPGQPSDQISTAVDRNREVVLPPSRSVSLPREQIASPESKKLLTRVNTFQPDNPAKHVHPKLPDYDDLAARFAALRGR